MQSPNDPPSTAARWVSFDQARMLLGMSEGTLRRAIRDGKVVAEQRRRNPESATDQRMIYEVLVTDPPAAAMPIESPQAPTPATDAPAVTTRLLETVLAQAETIAELRERVGRAEAAIDGANARAEQYALDYAEQFERAVRAEAELQRLRGLAERPWWRRLLGKPPA